MINEKKFSIFSSGKTDVKYFSVTVISMLDIKKFK